MTANPEKVLCSVNGVSMSLNLSEGIQRQMAEGRYEPTQTGWVRKHLKAGGVFVDVGANFGHYTTLAHSLVGEHGKVFAFDPSPIAYGTLEEAIGRAGISNVTLVNAAVGSIEGELTIFMPPETAGLHSPSAFESHPNFKPLSVPLLSLDGFAPLANCPVVDIVKIDVEGFEPDVLDGMRGLISAGKVKRVICEFNSWWLKANKTSVDELFRKFAALDFVIEEQTEWQRNLPAIKGETFDLQDVMFRYSPPVSMKAVQNESQVAAARKEMVDRGVSAVETGWRSILRRVGVSRGPAVGDYIKSWDVLETLRFLQRLDRSEPILDIGAYSSEIIVALHKSGYRNLHGADLDPRLRTMPHADDIHYEVCNFMETPFADGTFKAITSISVIEHGFDGTRLLTEVARLLRPGGYFIASFDYWRNKIDTSDTQFFGMSWRIFSEQEVRVFLEEAAGFGLYPVGDLSFEVSDDFVRHGGKRYTFGWLVLQKR